MQISLPSNLQAFVKEKMASGRYKSADEVIAEALKVLKNVEHWLPSAEDDLRREIWLGLRDLDEGKVSKWDVEEMKRRLRERLKVKKAS
jgi:antitoxin ParD1/3/4